MRQYRFETLGVGLGSLSIRLWSMALSLFMVLLMGASASRAQVAPPAVFFTDLTSGPNSGGESVSGFAGAYVTIYGNHFGATQGASTVTLNSANCLRIVSWGTAYLWYQKIVVQLGSSCSTGNLAVTVGGVASNAVPFTVRSGNVYCVAAGGSDSNNGKFPSCWATMTKAVHSGGLAAGDTVYIKNVTANSLDGDNASLDVWSNHGDPQGTAAMPIALIAYPGASATVAQCPSCSFAMRVLAMSYWTFSGFTVGGSSTEIAVNAKYGTDHLSFLASEMTCPNGQGQAACFDTEQVTNTLLYGNNVHNAGLANATKTYHEVYFSTDSNHTWAAWNLIHNEDAPSHGACRGIQFYSSTLGAGTGLDMFDLHVHDNIIHDTRCDGINFGTVNPNAGSVEAYNNVLYKVGEGPDPTDGTAKYSCINVEAFGSPTAPVLIYNNTCLNVGFNGGGDSTTQGTFSLYGPAKLTNNIAYQNNGIPYYTSTSGFACSLITGISNAFFGNGAAPGCVTNSLNVDPKFVNISTPDLHLQTGSPMIDAGVAIPGLMRDQDGVPRPQGAGYDMGAYEYFSGSTVQRPNPPTNLTVTVQ